MFSGTYRDGIALAILFIGAIFIGITVLDIVFYVRDAPTVGYRVQRWAAKNPILSAALVLVYAMLATHFLANKIGT